MGVHTGEQVTATGDRGSVPLGILKTVPPDYRVTEAFIHQPSPPSPLAERLPTMSAPFGHFWLLPALS